MSEQNPEMYDEINVLLGSLGKAYDMEGEAIAKAIELGQMTLKLATDSDGENYVEATLDGKVALVYPGSAKADMVPESVTVLDQE